MRARTRIWLAILGAAVVAGTAVPLGHAWRHPGAFPDPVVGPVLEDRLRVGETVYVGMTSDGPGSPVEIERVRAVLGPDSDAEITFLRCVLDPSGEVGWVGYVHDLAPCSSVDPVEGTRLDVGADPRQQIVMRIVPRAPGTIRVEGMDVTYRDGWRSGTQRTGLGALLHVT